MLTTSLQQFYSDWYCRTFKEITFISKENVTSTYSFDCCYSLIAFMH